MSVPYNAEVIVIDSSDDSLDELATNVPNWRSRMQPRKVTKEALNPQAGRQLPPQSDPGQPRRIPTYATITSPEDFYVVSKAKIERDIRNKQEEIRSEAREAELKAQSPRKRLQRTAKTDLRANIYTPFVPVQDSKGDDDHDEQPGSDVEHPTSRARHFSRGRSAHLSVEQKSQASQAFAKETVWVIDISGMEDEILDAST